jgi:N-acetylmuramoyl-L-alanine amidase
VLRRLFCYLNILALILLIGCSQKRTQTAKQVPAPPASVASGPSSKAPADPIYARSTTMMRTLAQSPNNVLPDALLNRTRCFVFITTGSKGLEACRDQDHPLQWNRPVIVSSSSSLRMPDEILLFVLSDRATRRLTAGELTISGLSVAAGKTLAQAPLLVPSELGFDIVGYTVQNNQLVGFKPSFLQSISLNSPKVVPARYSENDDRTSATEYLHWVSSFFNAIKPTGIIIHHSARIPTIQNVPKDVREVDDFHAERGFDIECFGREYHVAYHYLILRDGRIQTGRPERCQGAHARGYNSYIGISLVGDFSSKDGHESPTPEQIKSLLQLTSELEHRYNIPVQRILRHSDVGTTDCPGDRFAFSQFMLALMKSPAGGGK